MKFMRFFSRTKKKYENPKRKKGATFFPRKPPLHNRARNNRERVRQRQRAERDTTQREREKRGI